MYNTVQIFIMKKQEQILLTNWNGAVKSLSLECNI
jgi:hypothetical protein